MPLPSFSGDIEKNIIRHIKYRGTIRTGEIIVDNGDGTYDVKIALSDVVYPSIETIHYEMVFGVGEVAVLAFEYGSKESPKIIGHGKKIAQTPVEVEVDYSGTARVETLDAYSIVVTSAYLEGRIYLGGAGNCTSRGFQYGPTTSYGSDTHTDGSYGSGSYAIQITGLDYEATYHFRAYIIDENGDTQYGGDKIFTTSDIIDIGSPAISRSSHLGFRTVINKNNPAQVSGTITSVEIYSFDTIEDCKVAIFYTGGGNVFSTRNYVEIGTVPYGTKQTFAVNLNVQVGDYIGMYYSYSGAAGVMLDPTGGVGLWWKSSDYIPCAGEEFSFYEDRIISLYGIGPV